MHVPDHLRQAFADWALNGPDRPPRVRVLIPFDPLVKDGDARIEPWPVASLLYDLWDSTDTLPPAVADALRLSRPTTYAHAARLLWMLSSTDEYPCDSCSAAAEMLGEMDGDEFTGLYREITRSIRAADDRRSQPESEREPAPMTVVEPAAEPSVPLQPA